MNNNTRKWATLAASAVAISAVAFFVGRAWAGGIPATGALTYSGLLEDAAGAPLTGDHPILINLWDVATPGTTPLCQTLSMPDTLAGGRFSVPLPDSCADVIKSNADVWVEVAVDGVSLGTTKLGAVPYAVEAVHAVEASTANAPGGALASTISGLQSAVATPNPSQVILNGTSQQTASLAITGTANVGTRLGVGTTAPSAKLQVADDAQFEPGDVTANNIAIGHAHAAANGWDATGICASGGAGGAPLCMAVNQDWMYWGHQETAGFTTRMQLNGTTGNLSIAGTLSQASSEALKKDITYLDPAGMQKALDYVNKTPVATYRYKTMAENTKVIYGVIAEKTPSALLAQDDKAVNLSTTIGVLLASIKAQQSHINQLEARLKRIEHRPLLSGR
jgi:hypothetical protein